jgi:hypothetical protein
MTATDEAAPVVAGRSSTATATFRLANKHAGVHVVRGELANIVKVVTPF